MLGPLVGKGLVSASGVEACSRARNEYRAVVDGPAVETHTETRVNTDRQSDAQRALMWVNSLHTLQHATST